MLTKEKISNARDILPEVLEAGCAARQTCMDALAAYERVVALLEHEYEYSATIPWDAVRCALYGDAPDKAGG